MPPRGGRIVLTVGNFDGVHLAHRHICQEIREAARGPGARCGILTFDPHPLSVVAPDQCPPLMTTLDEKLARLEEQSVDMVFVEPFTSELAGMEAEEFIRRILHEKIQAALVFVGFNFRFGKAACFSRLRWPLRNERKGRPRDFGGRARRCRCQQWRPRS